MTSCFPRPVLVFSLMLFASSAAARSYFVDPRGGDDQNAGSQAAPFKTLERARDVVRTVNHNLDEDLIINLREGTFQLATTLRLDERDSGSNGFSVIYRAYQGEKVAVMGGHWIFAWQAEGSLWKAQVGARETRQLYVNWKKAQRARSPAGWLSGTKTAAGFSGCNRNIGGWNNIADLEVVYESQWKQFRCGVASAGATTITMQQPCFDRAQLHSNVPFDGISWLENARELLDQPGEWYLDRSSGWLYYYPRAGEDISSAVGTLPVVEELIRAEGRSLDQPIHHVRFEGLIFADSTWLAPSADAGFPAMQANFYTVSDTIFYSAARPGAALEIVNSQDIVFANNRFLRLGGVALSFSGGSTRARIVGNEFTDIAGAALMVGNHIDSADPREQARAPVIRDNHIHDVGLDYSGAAALYLGFVRDALVEHNELHQLPYTGISIGWRWNDTPSSATNNTIRLNHVHDHMKVLRDGGGIYSLGNQTPSRYYYNLIEGQQNVYGALYLDQGSKGVSLINNVVVDNLETALIKGTAHTIKWNYWNDRGVVYGWATDICFYDAQYPGECGHMDPSIDYAGNATIAAKEQAPSWIWRSAGRLPEDTPVLTRAGDFDGDGKVDLLSIHQTSLQWRVEASRRGAEFVWLSGAGAGNHNFVGDFNGDGKDDVVVLTKPDTSWRWHLALADSGGNSFSWKPDVLANYGIGYGACAYDYDGDGAEEIVIEYTPTFCVEYNAVTGKLDISECTRSCNAASYGEWRSCGSDVGLCQKGVELHDGIGWTGCQGAVGAATEQNDHLDHDCDGLAGCNDPDNHCHPADAGLPVDAAVPPADSGGAPGVDAAPLFDAGPVSDGGVPPVDASRADSRALDLSIGAPDGSHGTSGKGGCAVASSSGSDKSFALWALALLLFARRRRRG